jgi:uncharacterized protein (DUF305 family)
MTKTLSISLIIVALVIGVGVGFMISPEYANMGMAEEHSSDLGKADKNYDLRFLDGMIAHHMGAIDMAKEAKESSKNAEIIKLANNIINAQEKEIDQMYEWKKDWYNNTSKVEINDYSMSVNLGEYDGKFDLRFINGMIAHHEMAIEMAQDAQKKSTRNEILNLADAIINDQSGEIEMMEGWREDLYGIK